MDAFFTTATVLSTVGSSITIADKSVVLLKVIKKISNLIKHGRSNILIFGHGGAGKTTLGYKLSGSDLPSYKYVPSVTTEKLKIKGNLYGKYFIATGQQRSINLNWSELFRNMASGKFKGIINVVSYGYHSYKSEASFKETEYYKSKGDKDFLEHYLAERRKSEISQLRTLAENIKNTKGKFWMVTLVNKQDLWYDVKNDVESYYLNGDYAKIIKQISDRKGDQFIHHYVSASLVDSNLKIGKGFNLNSVPMYDEQLRLENFNNFIVLLNQMIDNGD